MINSYHILTVFDVGSNNEKEITIQLSLHFKKIIIFTYILKRDSTLHGGTLRVKIPPLYQENHELKKKVNHLSCIGKGSIKDNHCISQNAALFSIL